MDVDPVVEEVRRRGARIADECRWDIRCMAERFRREQAEGKRVIVRRRVRPETPREPNSNL